MVVHVVDIKIWFLSSKFKFNTRIELENVMELSSTKNDCCLKINIVSVYTLESHTIKWANVTHNIFNSKAF